MGNTLQTLFCQDVNVNDVDESGKQIKPESRKISDSILVNVTDSETRRFLCTLTLLRGSKFGDLICELGTKMKYNTKKAALMRAELCSTYWSATEELSSAPRLLFSALKSVGWARSGPCLQLPIDPGRTMAGLKFFLIFQGFLFG